MRDTGNQLNLLKITDMQSSWKLPMAGRVLTEA